MNFANLRSSLLSESRENGGLDTNVKAGKFGGADGFHGGAKVSGVLSARIVGVFHDH